VQSGNTFSQIKKSVLLTTVGASALLLSSGAYAQQVVGETETVVVTGSHISSAGYVAPTPVTAVSSRELSDANPSRVVDALRQLPLLSGTVGTNGATGNGTNGQTALVLRNLTVGNTLVLLNGNRISPTKIGEGGNLYSGVDISMLPMQFLQRTDIVTGGAGAVYGSDAVAGVVNFILDKNFNGVKGSIDGGQDDSGYQKEKGLKFAMGTAFGGGHGHFEASAEFYQNSGMFSNLDTKTGKKACAIINLPAGGVAGQQLLCNVRTANANFQGLVSSGPLKGLTFDNAGNPTTFNYGTLLNGSTMIGGDGLLNQGPSQLGASPAKNMNFYQRTSWDFGNDLDVYLDSSFGISKYDYQSGTEDSNIGGSVSAATGLTTGGTGLAILPDNAYLPASVKAAMAANKVTSFVLNKYWANLPASIDNNDTAAYRILIGAEGRVFNDWRWDAHLQNGQAREKTFATFDNNVGHAILAADAVVNPATGQIVCRSTLTNPTNGCVPVNPFGNSGLTPRVGYAVDGVSDAQLNYLTQTVGETIKTLETDAAFNLSGEAFQGPAGPVSVATGFEWRYESMNQIATPNVSIDPLTNSLTFGRIDLTSQTGNYNVKEGYVETDVPLLKDVPLVQNLSFNGALRETNYSEVGGLSQTFKLGLVWDIEDGYRVRGTFSRDVRAPSLAELFSGGAPGIPAGGVQNFLQPGAPINLGVIANSSGNPNLKPQHGTTMTVGLVLTPNWLPGFQASIDGWRIAIRNGIANFSTAQIVQNCAQGATNQCAYIIFNPDGSLKQVNQVPQNISSINTEGVDMETNYVFGLDDFTDMSGEILLHANANYISQFITNLPGSTIFNNAGVGLPQWRYTYRAKYTNGPFSMFLQARWTGSANSSKVLTPAQLVPFHIGGQTLVDMNVEYAIPVGSGTVSPYFNVTDLFNDYPPIQAGASANSNRYDSFGRHFRTGVRFSF
jgi:outer membrane receptor protein involved in Fe transport